MKSNIYPYRFIKGAIQPQAAELEVACTSCGRLLKPHSGIEALAGWTMEDDWAEPKRWYCRKCMENKSCKSL